MKIIEKEDEKFFLPSSSSSFNQRQKCIFGVLDEAEREQPQNRYTEKELRESERRSGRMVTTSKREMKQFQGKESIFKRPEVPLNKNWKRKMPDYQKNPHKWTKYSLEDVSNEQMSDKRNSATAMAFIKELSDRGGPPKHVIFNKHVKQTGAGEQGPEKPMFVQGKYVMPEYVVGAKPIKAKKVNNKFSQPIASSVRLDHLLDEDE